MITNVRVYHHETRSSGIYDANEIGFSPYSPLSASLSQSSGFSTLEYVNYSKEFAWPALLKRYQVSWI